MQLVRCAHQVYVQPLNRQTDCQTEVVFQAAEIGGYQLFQRRVLENVVSTLEGVFPFLWQVQRQNRLVNLHPFHAFFSQTREDFAVHRQQVFQQVEFVKRIAFGLAQPQVGQGTDNHRFDLVAQRQRLIGFFKQRVPAQLKTLIQTELRHQIVIVGIEPLGQLLGILPLAVLAAATGLGRTTGHAKQRVQSRMALSVQRDGKALRDCSKRQRVGQHLVIPSKIANRQQINAGVFLQLPVPGAQFTAHVLQSGLIDIAFPVGFKGFFKFAVCTDAWETEIVSQSH